MQGQAFPRVSFGEALLSSLQGEEVASRFRGGLEIFEDIMPVIMHKKKKRKNCNRIMTKRVA